MTTPTGASLLFFRDPSPLRAVLLHGIALVWVTNGVWCKVLGQVPRHAQIVARVVGGHVAPALTIAIGLAEVVMAAWWWSGRWRAPCVAAQVAVVLTMNVIEQVVAADLLLWGRFNLLWASLFCVVVVVVGRAPPRSAAVVAGDR
jgi:hypothetical protein